LHSKPYSVQRRRHFQIPEDKLDRLKAAFPSFSLENLFPFRDLVSGRIDLKSFIRSFLEQPLLWIRVKDEYRQQVSAELEKLNIPYSSHESGAISLPNRTSLDALESWHRGYFEVQDMASQQSLAQVKPSAGESWWDACSASGGKSLALFEKERNIRLTVTDVRMSVLENLKKRFQRAGIENYELAAIDLSKEKERIFQNDRQFNGIIADVPCSGSGTWARTPEWLSMFDRNSLEKFSSMQRRIVRNCIPYLEKDGTLVYITCSVFAAENEEIVSFICDQLHLELVSENYLQYSKEGADTMFVAIFRK
jgi:16S rRNA (cytosine967-C5)-methyltransferase